MWEAIAANRRRSRLLILFMGLLLLGLGFAIGMYVDPQRGAPLGMAVACGVWLVMTLIALAAGDKLLLASIGARKIEHADLPLLWNVVEEMTLAAGLARMPSIYILEDDAPNAFAVGRNPEVAAVAVTSGLLQRLNRDELQGVMAHEIAHVVNLDVRFMTLAGVMMGSITIIADLFLRSMRHGSSRRGSRGDNDYGGARMIFLLIALALAILAPLAAQVLYFACSREREYLADASAARFTRYPAGLAAALEKIAGSAARMTAVNRATAPMFIVNPLQAADGGGVLFATHPPIEKRVAILRAMAGSAGLGDYAEAFHRVVGEKARLPGEKSLVKEGHLETRAAGEPIPEGDDEAIQRVENVHDVLARLGDYVILPCACGMKIKLPPEYGKPEVTCPRCAHRHRIPRAMLKGMLAGAVLAEATAADARADRAAGSDAMTPEISSPSTIEPIPKDMPDTTLPTADHPSELTYRRRGTGWESFRCACGQALQLSPPFGSGRVKCGKCGARIAIEPCETT